MTERDLERIERLWADGVSMRVIADEMGYTAKAIYYHIRKDPERFPPRYAPPVPKSKRQLWVARIRAGRCTVGDAARATGVTHSQVYRWLKEDDDTDGEGAAV